ncbi:MAG: MEDS domain-containing protein [Gemmatimonadota bacterium]
MPRPFKREIRELEPGDHLSLLYSDREQQLAALVPLVREALSRGHRCRYLTDPEHREDIEEALAVQGIPVDDEKDRGRLEIASSRDAFLGNGDFDPEGAVTVLQEDLRRALEDGFEALWWISETSWLLAECRPEDVRAMEAHAQTATRDRSLIVVCQYDRSRLDDLALAEILAAHPLAILGDEVFPNPYYRPPEILLGEEGLSRVEWMIRQLEEQRAVRGRLRSREREFETLVENSPDLVARLDRDHRYLYVNPAVERFTGDAPGERLGKSHEEVVRNPEAARPWLDAIDRAFETGEPQSVEASFETPGGARWFETRIVPEEGAALGADLAEEAPNRDADSYPARPETVLVVARDITDRVRAEAERRRFEVLYRDLFRLSRDGIFISALDGTIVDINPAGMEMLRSEGEIPAAGAPSPGGLESIDTRELYVDPSRREELVRALKDGPVQDFPVRMHRHDGSIAEIILTAVSWRDEKGELVGMKGIIRDVTEEVVRRRQLEQTTRLFEKTLSSLDEAVFIVEVPKRKVVHCNEAAERMFGYSRDEMIETDTAVLHVDEEHHRRFGEETGGVVESGRTYRGEFVMRRKDGTVFPTYHTVAPLDSELGLESAVVSVIRDQTEQKRLELRLREIARQERRRLGHDLHDELGQELTGLALQANELRRRLDRQDGALVEVAEELEEGINRAIQSIRHVARGLLPEELEGRGLKEVLEELGRERRRNLGVNVDVDVDPTLRFTVEETAHLYRIAQEALLNAFRHGNASSVSIRVFGEEGGRVLRVRDDGIGFEGPEADTRGTGMGLEVMRHRADAMGGGLEIESRPGWGTTVTCTLPSTPSTLGTEIL